MSEHAPITIGLAVYNEGPYIEETLKSIQAQTFKDFIVLISDNGSTDDTLKKCYAVAQDDPRFLIHAHDYNRGAGFNGQYVYEQSCSDYFMFLGGHDTLQPDFLAETKSILDTRPDVSMVFGYVRAMDENSEIYPEVRQQAIYDFSQDNPLVRYIESVARLADCTIIQSLFRRKDLLDFSFRSVMSEDHILISRLLWKGKLHIIEKPLYNRRFFKERNSTAAERMSGENNKKRNYYPMYCSYLDDFEKLYEGDSRMSNYLVTRILTILEKRWGTSFLYPPQ